MRKKQTVVYKNKEFCPFLSSERDPFLFAIVRKKRKMKGVRGRCAVRDEFSKNSYIIY